MIGLGLLLIAGVCLGIGALLYVVHKFVPVTVRERYNEVGGVVFAVLGALYAVILAFVVVNEWDSMASARHNAFAEANELGALYWNARALPPESGAGLERTTRDYARLVIDEEWPLMAKGASSPRATSFVYQMRDQINVLPTDTPRQQVLFSQSVDHVNSLAAARRQRLSESSDGVPPILWGALILGAVLTVGHTLLFGLSSIRAHVLITAPLAVLVVLALVLVNELNHPFSGLIPVTPDAFSLFLDRLPPQR